MTTEQVPTCLLCGASATSVLLPVAWDRCFRLPGEFTLLRCEGCGLVRLSPRPDAVSLAEYYPAGRYYAYGISDTTAANGRRFVRLRDALRDYVLGRMGYPPHATDQPPRWLPDAVVRRATYSCRGFPRYVPGGAALDIGCGNGYLLSRLKQHGWHVAGVDTSAAAAANASKFGVDVFVGEVAEAPFAAGSFDFVHMSHVIEHARDPVAMLRRAVELLAPGGRLYIETPNVAGLGYRLAGRYWYPLETPRHLWLFTPSTLVRALREAGLEPGRVRAVRMPTYAWEATYRREDRLGHELAQRPAVPSRERPRAALHALAQTAAELASPRLAEVIAVWAAR